MAELALEQTLHGYQNGHRLLASSTNLRSRERGLLDQLSDLSGYLPVGLEFDSYWSGFPCGRWYAFARTWPDPAVPRAGAVITHTLLLPRLAAGQLDDLWGLASLHRRTAPDDASQVERSLAVEPATDSGVALARWAGRMAAAALFAVSERPVLWVSESDSIEVIRQLWRWQWPEARRGFSFCSFALQRRTLDGRPFTFLGVPSQALGSFHPLPRATVRIRGPAPLEHPTQEPWIEALLDDPDTLRQLVDWARGHALPVPRPDRMPALWRFRELKAGARSRLAAARARADLLAVIWPELPSEHPVWADILCQLIASQSQAPLAPRPLWELQDLLNRPQVREHWHRHEEAIRHEVACRLRAAPDALAHVPGVLETLIDWRAVRTFFAVTCSHVAETATVDEPGFADVVWALISLERPIDSLAEVLREAPVARRSSVIRLGFERNPSVGALDALQEVAEALDDLELLFTVYVLRGEPFTGLEYVARRAGDSDGWPVADRAFAELAWSPDEMARFCEDAPRGPEIFMRYADQRRTVPIRRLLETHRTLAYRLVRLGFDRNLEFPDSTARIALQAIDPAELLEPGILFELKGRPDAFWSSRVVQAIMPTLVALVVPSGVSAPVGDLDEWLGLVAVRRAFSQGTPRRRWARFPSCRCPDFALPHVTAALRRYPNEPGERLWYEGWLTDALTNADRSHMDEAVDGLLALTERAGEERAALEAEILGAVRRTRAPSGYRLVASLFPRMYRALYRGEVDAYRKVSWWFAGPWDRAKLWRHWLADVWVDLDWPAGTLREILAQDSDLRRPVVRRLKKSDRGMDLAAMVTGD